ncbi:hypothetical protein G5I_01624 [Acromyrmex echinatior]|uniref:Uncharacterized protein n=1 Tax=Acromyrmex echinatior TaxID=103372 RepID=F4W847_ACREC|nr:hypothetical protein G5I_01624 [Acromyrmex echinatior]
MGQQWVAHAPNSQVAKCTIERMCMIAEEQGKENMVAQMLITSAARMTGQSLIHMTTRQMVDQQPAGGYQQDQGYEINIPIKKSLTLDFN